MLTNIASANINKILVILKNLYLDQNIAKDTIKEKLSQNKSDIIDELHSQKIDVQSVEDLKPIIEKLGLSNSLLESFYFNQRMPIRVHEQVKFWCFVFFIIILNCTGFYLLIKSIEPIEIKTSISTVETNLFNLYDESDISRSSTNNVWKNHKNLILEFKEEFSAESMKDRSICIFPHVKGWTTIVSGSQIIFTPEEELLADVEYKISLPTEFKLKDRNHWNKNFNQMIRSEKLELISVVQKGDCDQTSVNCLLEFNYSAYPDVVKDYLTISSDTKEDLYYYLRSRTLSDHFYVNVHNDNKLKLKFQISKGFKSFRGNPIDVNLVKKLVVKLALVLNSASASWEDSRPAIELDFNQEITDAEIKKNISISPLVRYSIYKNWGRLYLQGDFKGGANYQINISKELASASGVKFSKDEIRRIKFSDLKPSIRFKDRGLYLSYLENSTVKVIAKNTKKIHVVIHSAYRNNVNFVAEDLFSKDYSKKIFDKIIDLNCKLNVPLEIDLPIGEWLKSQNSKLLNIDISFDRKDQLGSNYSYYRNRRDQKFISLSSIGMSCRKGRDKLHVWLNDLNHVASMKDLKVTCVSLKNQTLGEGVSDKNGLVKFKLNEADDGDYPNTIIIQNENQISFIKLNDSEKIRSGNDGSKPFKVEGYDVYLVTERGYYRPGETVHLEGIIRNAKLETPKKFPLIIEIIKPNKKIYKKINLVFDQQGAFSLDVAIPKDQMTGVYTAEVSLPGFKEILGKAEWKISDIVPRKIEVDLVSNKSHYDIKDEINIKIHGKHLYGDPSSGLSTELDAHWYKKPKPYFHNFKNYLFGKLTNSKLSKIKFIGSSKLNKNGESEYSFNSPMLLMNAPLELHLTGKVLEEGNRANPAYAKIDIHPYQNYLGINPVNSGPYQLGNYLLLSIISVNQKGQLDNSNKDVEILLEKENYHYILKKVNGYYEYVWESKRTLENQVSVKLNSGKQKINLLPKTSGRYIVSVKSTNSATVEYKFYVFGHGEESVAQKSIDYLDIQLDKQKYKVGDLIRVKINSPFKGKLLLTGEREDVLWSKIVDVEKFNQVIEIPLTTDFNFYICGTLIRPVLTEDHASPFCLRGYQYVAIDHSHKKLELVCDVPAVIKPNKKLKFKVKVMNQNEVVPGARVVLALVDKGVHMIDQYRLKDPLKYFHYKNKLEVKQYDIYDSLLPINLKAIVASKPGGGDGGGFLRKRLNLVDAERIDIFSMISKPAYSDLNGFCEFELDIPEYNGKLNLMLLSCKDNLFGSNTKEIVVKNDYWAEASFPLFLTSSDKSYVPFTIRNQLDHEGTFHLKIKSNSIISCDNREDLVFKIPSKENFTIQLPFSVRDEMGKGVVEWQLIHLNNAVVGRVELPIRARGMRRSKNIYGFVKAPGLSKIKIPGAWVKGSEISNLTITGDPWVKAKGALDYCIRYPYGCVEQTSSKAFPLLYANELGPLFDNILSEEKRKAIVDHAILRLQSMQTRSGGLSMWPSGKYAHIFGSIYACHFLVEAKERGFTIEEEFLNKLIKYLRAEMSYYKNASYGAYISYVISKYKRVYQEEVLLSAKKFDRLSKVQMDLYSMAFINSGVPQKIKIIKEKKLVEKEPNYFWNDPIKNKAMNIIFKIERGESNGVFLDVQSLLDAMPTNNHWGNTQRNAFSLLALGKAAKLYSYQNNWTGILNFSNKRSIDISSKANKKISDFSGNSVEFDLKGKGNLYYYFVSSGVDLNPIAKLEKKNVEVKRLLIDHITKKKVDFKNIKAGSLIQVSVEITTDMPYSNMVVNDLIPAGFTFERNYSTNKIRFSNSTIDYQDERDDRMITFINTIAGGNKVKFVYLIRATNIGSFFYPGLSVEHMYKANVFYNGLSERIEISK